MYDFKLSSDSTRGVYQRKLQRWLKYGPNHCVMSESSTSHLSVEESLQDVSHVQDEQDVSIIENVEDEDLTGVTEQATCDLVSDTSELDASPVNKHDKGSREQRQGNLPVVSQGWYETSELLIDSRCIVNCM